MHPPLDDVEHALFHGPMYLACGQCHLESETAGVRDGYPAGIRVVTVAPDCPAFQ